MTKDTGMATNYQSVMPYLIVKNAAEFIAFTEKVFGATQSYKAMRDEKLIMHAEIMIGGSTIMIADATEKYNVQTAGLFVFVENADEAFKKAIDAKATVITQVTDQPYGRSGGVSDPFGNTWWITSRKQLPEEKKKAAVRRELHK